MKAITASGVLEGDENHSAIMEFVKSGRAKKQDMEGSEIKIDGDILSLNYNHDGFYRVLYDDAMFETISRNLPQVTANEKWGLANDLKKFNFINPCNFSPDIMTSMDKVSGIKHDFNSVKDKFIDLTIKNFQIDDYIIHKSID